MCKESVLKNTTQNSLGFSDTKIWNMKVTVIPIVIGALGTVTKEELEDLEIRGDLLSLIL